MHAAHRRRAAASLAFAVVAGVAATAAAHELTRPAHHRPALAAVVASLPPTGGPATSHLASLTTVRVPATLTARIASPRKHPVRHRSGAARRPLHAATGTAPARRRRPVTRLATMRRAPTVRATRTTTWTSSTSLRRWFGVRPTGDHQQGRDGDGDGDGGGTQQEGGDD